MNVSKAIEVAMSTVIREYGALPDGVCIRTWQDLTTDKTWDAENDRTFPLVDVRCSPPRTDDNQATLNVDCAVLVMTNTADDKDHTAISLLYECVQTVLDSLFSQFRTSTGAELTRFDALMTANTATGHYIFGGFTFGDALAPREDRGANMIGLTLTVHLRKIGFLRKGTDMANFGALTDHFSMAETNMILVDSKKTPVENNRVDAQDENGDIAATDYHGNDAGTFFDASCTYAIKGSTINLNTLKLGEITAGTIIESIKVNTENAGWPQVEVTGKLGCQTVTAPTGKLNTFTPPSVTITGIKAAQPLMFAVGEGRLTSCSIEMSCELAQQDTGVGEPAAHGVSGASGTVNAEFVRITDAPAWTLTAGLVTSNDLTEIKAPGIEEGQATHHTASASAGFTIARDDAP